jgi:hypothetical protein
VIRNFGCLQPAKFSEEEDLSVGCKALRRKLTNDIVFSGSDFDYFLAIERQASRRCEELTIRRQWKCNGVWKTIWTGTFSTGSGEWDFDRCEFTVRPDVLDEYTCIMRAMNTRVNVLGADQVLTTASIAVDVEFGFSYSFFPSAGTGPVLYATQVDMVNGSNGGINGWGVAAGGYNIGNLTQEFSSNPPPVPLTTLAASGEMSGFDGSALAISMMDAILTYVGPFIGDTVLDFTIYRHVWWRERRTTTCEFGVPFPPTGTGWALVADNCGVDGTALYGRTPLFAYTGGNAGASGIISPSPPTDPCSTYEPAGEFGFDNRPMFVCFDANGTDPIELNRSRLFEDCANLILSASGCGGRVRSDFFEWDPVGDAPGYVPGDNYVTGLMSQVNALLLIQNSDALDPTASNPATLGEMTLKEMLVFMLYEFQVFWAIDADGNMRFEHWIYWTFPVGLNVATYATDDKSEPMSYAHLSIEVPRQERLKAAHASYEDFVGKDIIYSGPCVSRDGENDVKEYNLGPFTTDITFIFTDPDSISKTGFTVLATVFDGIDTYVTILDDGALTGSTVTNAPLSTANVQRDYWTWNRLLPTGNMNNEDTVFDGIQANIEQRNVFLKFCCDYVNFNSSERVTTRLGFKLGSINAFIRRAEFDEATDGMTLTLRYAY